MTSPRTSLPRFASFVPYMSFSEVAASGAVCQAWRAFARAHVRRTRRRGYRFLLQFAVWHQVRVVVRHVFQSSGQHSIWRPGASEAQQRRAGIPPRVAHWWTDETDAETTAHSGGAPPEARQTTILPSQVPSRSAPPR